jgi:hypothetical protein
MKRPFEELRCGATFNNIPCIHDSDSFTDPCHDAEIMRDEKDGVAMTLNQLINESEDLSLDGYIQSCGGLISDQDLRGT